MAANGGVGPASAGARVKEEENLKKSSFRHVRSRAARACEVCHSRKVRCDVVNHQPCTNCVAFGCECRVPEPKFRRGRTSSANAASTPTPPGSDSVTTDTPSSSSLPPAHTLATAPLESSGAAAASTLESMPSEPALNLQAEAETPRPVSSDSGPHAKDAVFMGSASHISVFLNDPNEEAEIAHIYTPWMGTRPTLTELQKEDIAILKMKGAFSMPPKEICDDLIEAYFARIHPVLPVVNKTQFLRQYKDPKNPPPLLLRQAVFCAAVNVCSNPALLDKDGRSRGSALVFYKRAKALFDAEYEEDRTVALTAALILSLSLDAPDKTNSNAFFWTRVAVLLAQSLGLHRWMPKSRMPEIEKRMWKRLWWSLFVRDRSTATAYGRPMSINLEDTDVPMLDPEDFDESEPDKPAPIPPNHDHITIFIHMVKLHEIMGLVLRQQYSVGAERLRLQKQVPDVSQCDLALATWVKNLPSNIRYSIRDISRHDYFKALIYLQYYSVLCLAHRPQVVHFSQNMPNTYPSWGIAFQAAHMIVKILENLRRFNEVSTLPAFCVYTCFSALIMLVYQTESPHENVLKTAQQALRSLMVDIESLAKVYEAAKQIVRYAPFLSSKQVRNRALRIPKRRRDDKPGVPRKRGAGVDASEESSQLSTPGSSTLTSRRPSVSLDGEEAEQLTREEQQKQQQQQQEQQAQQAQQQQRVQPQQAQPVPVDQQQQQQAQMQQRQARAAPRNDYANGQQNGLAPSDLPSSVLNLEVTNGTDEQLSAFSPELYMVTQTPQQIDAFEPQQLFPQAEEDAAHGGQTPREFLEPLFMPQKEIQDALLDETNSVSSNDDVAPDTLNMGDWYDFLMSNSAVEHGRD